MSYHRVSHIVQKGPSFFTFQDLVHQRFCRLLIDIFLSRLISEGGVEQVLALAGAVLPQVILLASAPVAAAAAVAPVAVGVSAAAAVPRRRRVQQHHHLQK